MKGGWVAISLRLHKLHSRAITLINTWAKLSASLVVVYLGCCCCCFSLLNNTSLYLSCFPFSFLFLFIVFLLHHLFFLIYIFLSILNPFSSIMFILLLYFFVCFLLLSVCITYSLCVDVCIYLFSACSCCLRTFLLVIRAFKLFFPHPNRVFDVILLWKFFLKNCHLFFTTLHFNILFNIRKELL